MLLMLNSQEKDMNVFEENRETFSDAKVVNPPTHTAEILVSAATILVLALSVYLTLFDGQTIF